VFVGTKSDLRSEHDYTCEFNNEKSKLYSKEEIKKRINYHGHKFMECSALDQKGLN